MNIMRFISISVFFFLGVLLAPGKENVELCGKIDNPVADYVVFTWQHLNRQQSDTASIGEDGTFNLNIRVSDPSYYVFRHGREIAHMYITPGDSLCLFLNTEEFDESLSFKGRGDIYNNYLAKKFLFRERNFPIAKKLYSLEEKRFIEKTDSLKLIMEEFLKDYYKSHRREIERNFYKLEKEDILYNWANQRLNYPYLHPYYAQIDEFETSEDYDDFLKKTDLNDEELLRLKSYNTFLNTYLKHKADKQLSDTDDAQKRYNGLIKQVFEVAVNEYKHEKIRDYILFRSLSDQIQYRSIKDIKPLIEEFNQLTKNTAYISQIDTLYKKWIPLEEGKKAPGFTYVDVDSNKVSLKDFRGKYVYIDVWASWCRPCFREIPFLHKLEEEFHDKNIVFVSISVDRNRNAWETMLNKQQLGGIQLHAGGWDPALRDNYLVNSIPRFILIDREGKIIDANAMRPSENIAPFLHQLEGI